MCLTGLLAVFSFQFEVRAQTAILQTEDVLVLYEPSLEKVAGEVLRIYPLLQKELENILTWRLESKTRVVLLKSPQRFRKTAGNAFIVAYAIPDKDLIVIDYSKIKSSPFNLHITLKHELCHLLLHQHVRDSNMARWFDEGFCQLVSDGVGEMLIDKNWSGLDAAVVSGRTLPLSRLAKNFPEDRASLMLAYVQSKSVVTYIDRHYGSTAIFNILADLKNGETMETAMMQRLSLSTYELEKEWLKHIQSTPRWIVFLANNLYGILFFLAAILTVCGFILRFVRKKRWEEGQESDDE